MAKSPSTKKPAASNAEKPNQELSLPAPAGDHWKGPAVVKTDGIVHRLLDRYEPENIVARERAKAESRIIKAHSKAQVQIVRAEGKLALQDVNERAMARVLSTQIRQQENIEAVIRHTYAALPPADAAVSDEPVSEDFIHRLFDDCKNIGDEEMQTLWGRILAGEIVRPGSFHPKTLGIVRDLTKEDAHIFVNLCRFGFGIGGFSPIVFDTADEMYNNHDINFSSATHLENLGLIHHHGLSGFSRTTLPKNFVITYAQERFSVTLQEGQIKMPIGTVLLSSAGKQLAPLTNAQAIPGFPEYAISRWAKQKILVAPA